MNENNKIYEAYKSCLNDKNEIKLDEGVFYRLPGHVINNELYEIKREFDSFYSSQKNGNDVNIKYLNNIIKQLNNIKKEVKSFNNAEDVPVSYQYSLK